MKENKTKRYATEGVIIAKESAIDGNGDYYGEYLTIICGNRRRIKFLNIDYGLENYDKPMVFSLADKVRIVYEKTQGKTNIIIGIKKIN